MLTLFQASMVLSIMDLLLQNAARTLIKRTCRAAASGVEATLALFQANKQASKRQPLPCERYYWLQWRGGAVIVRCGQHTI